MDDVRRLTVQLAVAKAVKDQAETVIAAVKERLESSMDPGDRKTVRLGEHNIGTVSYATTSTEAKVTDPAAFVRWVMDVAPGEIHKPVTVDAYDVIAAVADEPVPEAVTRLVQAVMHVDPQVRPAYTARILSGCQKAGAAVDPQTGEEIPGITVTPGGRGKYVSARISADQMDALFDAYGAGEVDLIELGTTVPPTAIGEATT